METTARPKTGGLEVPDHIPAHLVVDFDLYNLPGADRDIHHAYLAFQERGPDIFWTPHNGGHWVTTRSDDIKTVQCDHARFSHELALSIPPVYSPERNYPIQVDPPRHRFYRAPLVRVFQPRAMEAMIPKIRAVTNELLQAFVDQGECDFVADFAEMFPIFIFLDLVELPREDRAYLLPLAKNAIRGNTNDIRIASFIALNNYLIPWVEKRRNAPGADLISVIANVDIEGQKISAADALTFTRTVVLGGLDTVTSLLSFIIRFFAASPEHQRLFKARMHHRPFVRRAAEELMRRHGIVNTTRVATHDFTFNDAPMRNGDMILMPNMYVGLDDRHVSDPLVVDFERETVPVHAAFDFGPHTCVGASLARAEIRTFLEEWFAIIPEFRLKSGTSPEMATGMVNAILRLDLTWPVSAST